MASAVRKILSEMVADVSEAQSLCLAPAAPVLTHGTAEQAVVCDVSVCLRSVAVLLLQVRSFHQGMFLLSKLLKAGRLLNCR